MTGDKAPLARVQTSDHDGVIVAVTDGEIDMVSVDDVRKVLFDSLDKRPDGLVIDLAVSFIGSAGLSLLLELYGRAQGEGIEFAIVASTSPGRRPLEASGLNQVLPVADTVEAAIELIKRPV